MPTEALQLPAIVPCASCGTLNRVNLSRADDKPVCGPCRAPLTLDVPLVLTDATFDRVIQGSSVPVIVDFYADWCGPCRMMAPLFADLARAYRGRAIVAKVDTEQSREISARYGIRSLPTLTVHRGGKEVARQVGAVPMAVLDKLLRDAR